MSSIVREINKYTEYCYCEFFIIVAAYFKSALKQISFIHSYDDEIIKVHSNLCLKGLVV